MVELGNQLIGLVKNHWVEVLAVIGAVDVILGVIVKLTKSTWDDNVYTHVHTWVAKLLAKK